MPLSDDVARIANWAVSRGYNQTRSVCPQCSSARTKNKTERCLSVNVDDDRAVYKCWHCGIEGIIPRKNREQSPPAPQKTSGDISSNGIEWLKSRRIDILVARDYGVFTTTKFIKGRGLDEETEVIGFPYHGSDGKIYAVKYRALKSKAFTQEGAAKSFCGLEKIDLSVDKGERLSLVITEGEIDMLAAKSAVKGFDIVSAPNGAPMAVSNGRIDPKEDKKFSYIWDAKKVLKEAPKIILAVDGDSPGRALGEEIARRVGKARCWEIKYPEGCKDLNDVAIKFGPEKIQEVLEAATPWPIAGLYSAKHYETELTAFYSNGYGRGVSTGFSAVDELFTVVPGQVTIITGIPGSGKSEFIDQLMHNIIMGEDWKFAIWSPENPPQFHIAKMIERYAEKPFTLGFTQRMDLDEMKKSLEWVDEHYAFIDLEDDESPTLDAILDRGHAAVQRLGIRGLVIDPFNYIEQVGDNEVRFINNMLTKVRAFATNHDVHVWIVAHPQKLYRHDGNTPVPTGYDISGSAHWFNKADIGITVHRPDKDLPQTEVHCWKCRWKWVGKVGKTLLDYQRSTGIYTQNAHMKTVYEGGQEDIDSLGSVEGRNVETKIEENEEPEVSPWDEIAGR